MSILMDTKLKGMLLLTLNFTFDILIQPANRSSIVLIDLGTLKQLLHIYIINVCLFFQISEFNANMKWYIQLPKKFKKIIHVGFEHG